MHPDSEKLAALKALGLTDEQVAALLLQFDPARSIGPGAPISRKAQTMSISYKAPPTPPADGPKAAGAKPPSPKLQTFLDALAQLDEAGQAAILDTATAAAKEMAKAGPQVAAKASGGHWIDAGMNALGSDPSLAYRLGHGH